MHIDRAYLLLSSLSPPLLMWLLLLLSLVENALRLPGGPSPSPLPLLLMLLLLLLLSKSPILLPELPEPAKLRAWLANRAALLLPLPLPPLVVMLLWLLLLLLLLLLECDKRPICSLRLLYGPAVLVQV